MNKSKALPKSVVNASPALAIEGGLTIYCAVELHSMLSATIAALPLTAPDTPVWPRLEIDSVCGQ